MEAASSRSKISLDTAEASHLLVNKVHLRDIREKRLLSRCTREAGRKTASAISRVQQVGSSGSIALLDARNCY